MVERITRKQSLVMDDLFSGEADEATVLAKHKVSRNTFNKWLDGQAFQAEFARRMDSAYRQGRLIIARYVPLAAAKLVELTESDKEETARKACLDIISQQRNFVSTFEESSELDIDNEQEQLLEPASAGRILASLARERAGK